MKTTMAFFAPAALACATLVSPALAGSTTSSGVPNPSDMACLRSGGTIVPIKDVAGNESSLCSVGGGLIEAWTLFDAVGNPAGPQLRAIEVFARTFNGTTGGPGAPFVTPPVFGGSVGVPNPSARYCVNAGGALSTIIYSNGNQAGLCSFTDGSALEAWTLWEGALNPANAGLANLLGL